jgi:hypothetical protein
VDQKEFDAMMARADEAIAAKRARETQAPAGRDAATQTSEHRPAASQKSATDLDAEGRRPDGTLYSEPPRDEPGLGDASGLDAIAGGALKSGFETGDFLLGETAPEDRSSFRRSVEETVKLRSEQSMLDGFSAGVAQFAGAMVGLGKVSTVAKALPWFGKGFGAATAFAPKTAEVGKAALAGTTAFDPHEERLSNLIQETPLANDFNGWLAADPTDSAAEGRLKAALESIGMDLAIIGTFMGAGRVWKHLRNGDADGASRAVDDMEAAQRQHIADAERAEMEAGEPFDLDMPLDDSGKAVEGPQASPVLGAEELPEGAQRPAVSQGEPLANPDGAAPAKADLETPEGALQAETGKGGPSIPTAPEAAPAPAPRQYRIQLAAEDTEAVLKAMSDDVAAMDQHGSWDAALKAGHQFGRGEKVPYAKLNNPPEVAAFLARLVDATEERLDRMKGGSVLSDEMVTAMVGRRAALFNEDPAQLLKEIHQAGADATHAVAKMEAGYMVSSKLMQDSYALAMRIKLGDLSEFGSREAALEALKTRMALASSVYGAARSITAASGRAENEVMFRLIAEDPLENMEWSSCDKPFQALAAIFEWVDFLNTGFGYVSHLPVMVDGTCNGIQHLSAILRDEVAGAYVNLVPGEKPRDIYKFVAEELEADLRDIASIGGEEAEDAQWWLDACGGVFPRGLTKRQVMVLPYGGTKDSFYTYTREWLDENHPVPPEGLDEAGRELRSARVTFLAGRMWEVVHRVVRAGMQVMGWLQDCVKALRDIDAPLRWQTPSGFAVIHFYGRNDTRKCELMVDGTRLQLTRLERGSKLSIKDQLKGVAPNFIHSLDAAALVLCLERCRTAGIEDISAIHDAYGTHAANMEPLSVFLREAFVEVHRVDVLGGFRAACRTMLAGHLMEVEKLLPEEADRKADAALPPPLRHGGLNLEAVLRSDYFFA